MPSYRYIEYLAWLVASALSCLTATSTEWPSLSGRGDPSPRNSGSPSASHRWTCRRQVGVYMNRVAYFSVTFWDKSFTTQRTFADSTVYRWCPDISLHLKKITIRLRTWGLRRRYFKKNQIHFQSPFRLYPQKDFQRSLMVCSPARSLLTSPNCPSPSFSLKISCCRGNSAAEMSFLVSESTVRAGTAYMLLPVTPCSRTMSVSA